MKSLIKQPASTAGVKSDFGLEEAANEEEEACTLHKYEHKAKEGETKKEAKNLF